MIDHQRFRVVDNAFKNPEALWMDIGSKFQVPIFSSVSTSL